MINKRLLIKNLLAYNDENTFYDKKRKLDFSNKEGKAKFLKHVCALSNSNPENNSYIVVGVDDEDNRIRGVDFYDDSKIQNLINAYLENPPLVHYENVRFPTLPKHKVIGLVTIQPTGKETRLRKNIWKYWGQTMFHRIGSNSLKVDFEVNVNPKNKNIVTLLEKNSYNSIKYTLEGVFEFFNQHEGYNPKYKVFKDLFVLCWAGLEKKSGDKTFYSRVDIELINEQKQLFYSALDEVKIKINENSFIITEYVQLGINNQYDYFPLEKTIINFKENGQHDIVSDLLFEPPKFNKEVLHHIYNTNNTILEKIIKNIKLNPSEKIDYKQFPATYMICSLNGFKDAKQKLEIVRPFLRELPDKKPYIKLKEAMRVLRKVNYN